MRADTDWRGVVGTYEHAKWFFRIVQSLYERSHNGAVDLFDGKDLVFYVALMPAFVGSLHVNVNEIQTV